MPQRKVVELVAEELMKELVAKLNSKAFRRYQVTSISVRLNLKDNEGTGTWEMTQEI